MKIFTRICIFAGLFLLVQGSMTAQVTVTNPGNTTPGLMATYTTLAAAITDLNAQTAISGPVTITLAASNPQTCPAGGYSITALLTGASSINTVTITGSGNTITAPSPAGTAGNLNDAIFKFIGSDFMTLQNFVMNENAANTTTAAATNNMVEWGVALLYATSTNGAQNITIQNNTIALNRTYQNTFGIYSNSTHTAAAPTTSATATTTAGGNSGSKIYGNTINNVNQGIVVIGATAAADANTGIDIGGTGGAQANTITNFGTTGTFSAFANVSGTVNGILVRNSNGFNVSFNTLTSSVGGTTVGTLNGIQVQAASNTPTATFTNTINSNNISLQSGLAAGAINGINYPAGSASATSTANINSNNFGTFGHTVAASGTITFITLLSTNLNTSISSNTFTNITTNTTGSVTFFSNAISVPTSGGTQTINSNSIVTAFNKTGAGGTITVFSSNASSVTGSIISMQNNNFSNITVTGATGFVGINNTDGGSPTKTVSGNTFNNINGGTGTINPITVNFLGATSSVSTNTITNISWGAALTGLTIGSSSTATTLNVSSNIITNLSSTASVTGLTVASTSTTTNINNNTISTLSSTGAVLVTGLGVSGAATANVFKNKICDLSGSNATSTVSGILISGGTTVNVYNNLIGDLRTPAANAANPLIGLSITGGTTVNAYFNTVRIAGTSSGALFGSSAVSVSSTPTVSLRNNIFVNLSTTNGAAFTAAHRRSSTTLTSYAAASNNNLFYAGTPGATNVIFYDGTSNDQTLAAYKTRVASRDNASITENVPFLSTTCGNVNFLHIDPTVPTQVESGAAMISGITDDYDGDVRNVSTPDIGGDEGTFTLADLSAPSIATITLVGTACNLTSRNVTAVLTDPSGVDNASFQPRIYFRKNGGAYSSAAGSLTSGTVNSGTWTFTITYATVGGVVASDVIDYFIVAQDALGNAGGNPQAGLVLTNVNTVTTPPTTPLTYTVQGFLSGSYNVGAGQPYTTLSAAISAYNNSCLAGAVTFLLTDAAYTEASAMTINANANASATNTLTIKPTLANTTIAVTGGSATAIFFLNGADYVTIDGSISATANTVCPASAASRDLTITNTNTGTSSAVIWLGSNGADGATNNTIKNCKLVGSSPTTGTLVALGSGSSTIGLFVATAPNNSNSYINNDLSKATFAILSIGTSAAAKNTGTIINQNIINTALPNNISRGGIFVAFDDGVAINGNNISNISGTTSNYAWGISCGLLTTSATSTTGNDVTNATITKNIIGSIRAASTYGVAGISVASVTSGTTLIADNMIADAFTNGTSGDIGAGIYIGGGVGSTTNVYYNSIQMASTLTGGALSNFGIAINGSNPVVDLRNNIITNTGSNGANLNRAIGLAYSTFTNLTSNYNDLIVAGTGSAIGQTGTLLGTGFTASTTLANWQTNTTKDANSQNVAPVFVSSTDLHLFVSSNPLLNGTGTPVSVTVDIDCVTRNATTPDIGADEFDEPVIVDAGVTAIVLPPTVCGGSVLVSATVKNFGTVTLTSLLIDWTVTPGGAQPQVNPGVISIAPGASATFPLGSFTFVPGTVYSINAVTSSPNGGADGVPGNDAFTQGGVQTGMAGTYTVGAGGNYANLTAAVADYNTRSLCGAVLLSLTDAAYTEAAAVTINANTAASATNTLTIKPTLAGTTIAVTGGSSTAIFVLNGADYVTIDGSISITANTICPVSAASRDITLTNTNTGGSSAIIWLQTTAVGANAATNNTIKNCIIVGNSNTTTLFGLGSGSATISITSLGTGNNNNSFVNNNISKTQYGIYSQGASAANKNTGTVINQNLVNTVSPNNVQVGGIWVGFESGVTISGNNIGHINTSTITPAFGITLGLRPSNTFTAFAGNEVTGATVSKNVLNDILRTGDGTSLGIAVSAVTTTASPANTISNNMIAGVRSTAATPSDFVAGILVGGGAQGSTKIYYNSISLTGLGSNTSPGFAIAIGGTDPVVDVRNNIFVNKMTSTSGKMYAIGLGYSTYVNLTSDNNDFYTTAAPLAVIGGLSNTPTGDQATLAAWQGTTAKDANSKNIDPNFVSATDLHLVPASNAALNNFGTPIAVTDDIDCDTRSVTTPDMGADEFEITVSLNLTAFIEGFMNGSTMRPVLMNSGVGASATDCDNITVELHNATAPYALAQTFTGVLQTNGTLTCTFPGDVFGKSFYIVLKHRNALQTWSAAPIVISASTSYNFSTAATQAYGSNMVLVGSLWTLYSGDINSPKDDNIDFPDYSVWEADYFNFAFGYIVSDLNGDGTVDFLDYPIWEKNYFNFVSTAKP